MSNMTGDSRIEDGLVRDEHLSRVVTWAMVTLGKAVALATAVAFVAGLIAVITQTVEYLWLGAAAAPLSFALVLYNSAAPMRRGGRVD